MFRKKCSQKNCKNPLKDEYGTIPLEQFSKSKKSMDGVTTSCKFCNNEKQRIKYKNDPEYRNNQNIKSISWNKKNAELVSSRRKKNYLDNSENSKKKSKEWMIKNRDRYNKNNKIWAKNNKIKAYKSSKKWRDNNKILVLGYQNKYRNNHTETITRHSANRRARKLKAIPVWLTKEQKKQINIIYDKCPFGYEIDHIIPLITKDKETGEQIACGLHVPWNLQYLTEYDNLSKNCWLDCYKITYGDWQQSNALQNAQK